LGLTVYGHRTRGNCADIETIVAPAVGTAPAIESAVSNIQPLGKTPMTDAVIAAAQALRYTEDSATVILVSDGVETCNPDPCAAARLLEEAGIDFTAHVIGFDVGSDPNALAQMQCIAEETGGKFLTADNADQLSEALTSVATSVAVHHPSMELALEQQFVAIGDNASITITFPIPVPAAELIAPNTAIMGSTVQVGWNGPDGENDYVAISSPDETGYINYTYTREGRSLDLLMPTEPGTFDIRYYSEPGATRDS